MQLPAPPPSAALPGKPRRGSGVGIEGAAWGRRHSLVLGRGPHGGGGGSPGPLPVPQPTLIPTPNDCPKLEVFPACISSPRPASFAFLPLSLCVSSLALRSLPYFSSLCGCLSLHLRLHFFLCLTLSLAVPWSLLRSLLASCSFSLPLFVWLSLLSLPSAVPPPTHTSQPCLRCPQGWQVGGAAAETG